MKSYTKLKKQIKPISKVYNSDDNIITIQNNHKNNNNNNNNNNNKLLEFFATCPHSLRAYNIFPSIKYQNWQLKITLWFVI